MALGEIAHRLSQYVAYEAYVTAMLVLVEAGLRASHSTEAQ